MRAKVKLAGIVTALKSDPDPSCCASASVDPDPAAPSVLLPRSKPESCRPQAPLAACCPVTFRPVLKTPLLLGTRVGVYSGCCMDAGSACAPAHVFPASTTATQGSGFCSCPLVCACVCTRVSWCTCGARGQLVGVVSPTA